MDASSRQKSIESGGSSTSSQEEVDSSSKIKQLVKSNEDMITPSDTSLPESSDIGQKKTDSNHSMDITGNDITKDKLGSNLSDGIWCGSTGSGLKEDKNLNITQSRPGGYQEMRYQTPGPRTAYLQSVPEAYKEAGPSTNVYKTQLQADFAQQYPRPIEQPVLDEQFVNNIQRPLDSAWLEGYPPWNNVTMQQTFGPRPYPETLHSYPSSVIQEPVARSTMPSGVMYNRQNEGVQTQQYSQHAYQIPQMPPAVYNHYMPDVYSSPIHNERFHDYARDEYPPRPEQVFRFDNNNPRGLPDYRPNEMFLRDVGVGKITNVDYTANMYDYSVEPPLLGKRGFEQQVPFNMKEGRVNSPKREDFPKCSDKGTNTAMEAIMMYGPPKLQNNQSRDNVHQKCNSPMRLYDDTNPKPNYKPFVGSGKQTEKDPVGGKPPWRNIYPPKSGGCGGGMTRLDKTNPSDTMKTFSNTHAPLDNNQKPRYGIFPSPCTDSTARNYDNRLKPMDPGTSGLPGSLLNRPKFTNQAIDFHSNYRTQVCTDKSANKGYIQDSKLPLTPEKYMKDTKLDQATLNRIFGNESARRNFGFFLDDLNAAKKGAHRRCSELEKKAHYRR